MLSDKILDGISAAGTVLAVLLFCAQIPTYYVIVKNRAVGSVSILPTLGLWANTSAWVVYALLIKNHSILIVNVIGAVLGLLYLAVYLTFSPTTGRTALLLAAVLAVCAVVYCGIALPPRVLLEDKSSAMGSIAVACNVLMFASPLAQLRIALKSYDPTAIPMLLVVIGTLASMLWGSYGLLLTPSNWFVAGPNLAGIVLGLLQLGIAIFIILAVRNNPSLSTKNIQESGDGAEDSFHLLDNATGEVSTGSKAEFTDGYMQPVATEKVVLGRVLRTGGAGRRTSPT